MSEQYEDDIIGGEEEEEEEFAGPIPQHYIDIITLFKKLIQSTKTTVYNSTIAMQEETGDTTNLDGLNEYETQMLTIGTNLLEGILGTEGGDIRQKRTPISLWNIITEELPPEVLILIEHEIRTQFILHPFVRRSSQNIE